MFPKKKDKNDYDFIVYISDIPWNDIKQRQHHISNELSKYFKILFFSCNSITKLSLKKNKCSVTIKQLFLLPFTRLFLVKKINLFLAFLYLKLILKNKNFILILSHPSQKIFLNLNYKKLIYDYVDPSSEYETVSKISKFLKKNEEFIMKKSDYIFAPSKSILKNLENSFNNKEILYVPNAVNIKDFKIKKYDFPRDIKPFKNDKMVGFYGAVNELFDLELIKFIANKSPEIKFIIIGPIFIKLKNLPNNVLFLGKKEYSELIKYLCNIKLWIIPFVQSDLTKLFNPVKAYEYLCSGRYIVTTFLPELNFMKKYISITNSYYEFHKEIIKNIDNDNLSYLKEIKKMLNDYTWENIIKKSLRVFS